MGETANDCCTRCKGLGWYWRTPDGFNPFLAGGLQTARAMYKVTCNCAAVPSTHVLPPAVTGQMEIDPDVTAAELGVNTEQAPAEKCNRCQGNGEIVTDWERYRHPHEGDVGDEAVAECPDCGGEGIIDVGPPPAPRAGVSTVASTVPGKDRE